MPLKSTFQKLLGTIADTFQIGTGGPRLKRNAAAIEAKNAGDSALAIMRGADGVGATDFATVGQLPVGGGGPSAMATMLATADVNTTANTFTPLFDGSGTPTPLQVTLTGTVGGFFLVWFTASARCDEVDKFIAFQLTSDGAAFPQATARSGATGTVPNTVCVACQGRIAATGAPQTFEVEWFTTAAHAWIETQSNAMREGASLLVQYIPS